MGFVAGSLSVLRLRRRALRSQFPRLGREGARIRSWFGGPEAMGRVRRKSLDWEGKSGFESHLSPVIFRPRLLGGERPWKTGG